MTTKAPVTIQNAVVERLNYELAIATDLHSQVKQAHWTVVGSAFIAIHRLFDEQATMLLEHADLFAERMRALGAVPHGTIRLAAAESDLPEFAIGEIASDEAVREILARFVTYSASLGAAMDIAGRQSDLASQDIFIEAQRAIDTQSYFLRSHITP